MDGKTGRKKWKMPELNGGIIVGGLLLLIMILLSVLAPLLASYDPNMGEIREMLKGPCSGHILGTDNYGRDILSRVLYGGRVSYKVGITTVGMTIIFGTLVGLLAGYYWKIDAVVMRIVDGLTAFPAIVLAMSLMAVFGQSDSNLIFALTIVYIPGMTRVIRSSVMSVKHAEYVEAARAIGSSSPRILLRHILPNIISPLIVQATLVFGYAVLAEAGLSYLGMGTQPPTPSWGNMLNEGRNFMVSAPWLMVVPGVFNFLTVLALNILGDGLRDLLDPKTRK
ncbi:MAG: ABC transporter permease [Lachnospiraceae bacterium]|nr:ABC transporter permease [Lachnospiraceae bacterium]